VPPHPGLPSWVKAEPMCHRPGRGG
jgi:hypothetical protein